MYTGWFTGS